MYSVSRSFTVLLLLLLGGCGSLLSGPASSCSIVSSSWLVSLGLYLFFLCWTYTRHTHTQMFPLPLSHVSKLPTLQETPRPGRYNRRESDISMMSSQIYDKEHKK